MQTVTQNETHPGHEKHTDQVHVSSLGGKVQCRHRSVRDSANVGPVGVQKRHQVKGAGLAGYQERGVTLG